MSRLPLLLEQIRSARTYTEGLLAGVPPDDWFRMPDGGVTHLAWQVGHLAMAEYRLCLERIRGRRPGDEGLITDAFLDAFGRGSVPVPQPASYPPISAIRAAFDRIHGRAMAELASLDDRSLDAPPEVEHRLCASKGELLGWCARHEMFHAGQIALLRRLFGAPPRW